ncbi:hypothetical protein U1Q18_017400 [Sarracenia purpurea var. burkii]
MPRLAFALFRAWIMSWNHFVASIATLSFAIGTATFPFVATLSYTICYWNLDGNVSGMVWCWNWNGLSWYWNGMPNMGYCFHHPWFTFR